MVFLGSREALVNHRPSQSAVNTYTGQDTVQPVQDVLLDGHPERRDHSFTGSSLLTVEMQDCALRFVVGGR